MDFSFFRTNNKSGYKTNEKWVKKNYPNLYENIINHSNIPEISFKEKLVLYFLGIKERPKCVNCGSEIKFRNRLDKPYGEFCSIDCFNSNKEEMISRIKQSNNEKYGVNFYPQHEDFFAKVKITKKNNFGDENFVNVDKAKKTKLLLYGNENFVNVDKAKKTNLERYGVENVSNSEYFINLMSERYKLLYPNIDILTIDSKNVKSKCSKCGETTTINKQMFYERNKISQNVCLICNPIGQSNKSFQEIEISEFIKPYCDKIENNIKIDGIEVDIILNNKIGIEFNGLYWHNELFKDSDFHLNKTKVCNKNGIELIHIFEDEWKFKKNIVKSILLNKINKTPCRIFARKCEIKEIDSKICEKFLEENHIQGKVKSSIRLGAFFNEELVSVITFSKGRMFMGGKEYEWELNRFCNKINTSVVGIFSKFLKHVKEHYNLEKIVTYSDIRMFDGNLYEKNGFKKISQSKPNYWYILGDIRKHRFNYRKSILVKEGFDSEKTERQIMFERKIYRIYDCGNIRWEIDFKKNV